MTATNKAANDQMLVLLVCELEELCGRQAKRGRCSRGCRRRRSRATHGQTVLLGKSFAALLTHSSSASTVAAARLLTLSGFATASAAITTAFTLASFPGLAPFPSFPAFAFGAAAATAAGSWENGEYCNDANERTQSGTE
jgi:hypothetical protein